MPSTGQDSVFQQFRDTVLEHYATNAAARAAVTIIPILGGGMDALFGTAGSNVVIRRLEVFFEELRSAIDAVQARIDQAVTEEQLYDAAIKAVRGAIDTGDREKVRLLAAILAEATTLSRPEKLDPEAVLTELANLSPATLRVARNMYEECIAPYHPDGVGITAPTDISDAEFHVQRLEAAGLIEVVQPADRPGRGSTARLARYEPTSTFRRIMAMIRHDVPAPKTAMPYVP